jgi:hypothetical protein
MMVVITTEVFVMNDDRIFCRVKFSKERHFSIGCSRQFVNKDCAHTCMQRQCDPIGKKLALGTFSANDQGAIFSKVHLNKL